MNRNLNKWRESGERSISRHERYDLTGREVNEILNTVNGTFDLIQYAFTVGVEVGRRIQKAES